MTKVPYFREFYQKASIVIGESDRLSLAESQVSENHSHWLIALEGEELENGGIHWKVVTYPSDISGLFDYVTPYFVSPFYESINDAIECITRIASLAKQDQLRTVHK